MEDIFGRGEVGEGGGSGRRGESLGLKGVYTLQIGL